jgi:hypothetical protein
MNFYEKAKIRRKIYKILKKSGWGNITHNSNLQVVMYPPQEWKALFFICYRIPVLGAQKPNDLRFDIFLDLPGQGR